MLVAINTVLFLNLQILQFSALTTILILLEAALAGDLMLNKQWEQVKLSYLRDKTDQIIKPHRELPVFITFT